MTTLTQTSYATLQETVYRETLPNGLTVYLVPKAGYAKTYAVFTTRYGSIDNHFQQEGGPEQRVTDGIAHFLEHKLFEEEWGDIFHTFAENGANANAFTSHNRTSYLFSATDKIDENLTTLLDFVQRPYLTPENVEKEKGIIEQEIRMYDEMPFWRCYKHLLESLFHTLPVRIDIAGTVESIYQIDREALMTCYSTFYHPSNMVLAIVGDVDPTHVMGLVRDNQAAKAFTPARAIQRFFDAEPNTVSRPRHEIRLAVSRPLVLLGWKDASATPNDAQLRRELVLGLVQDLVFGRTSQLFQELLDSGLIDDALSYDYEVGPGYGFSYLGSETDEPEALEAAIRQTLERVLANGLDPEDFERARRKQLGDYLHGLNSPEAMANQLTDALFKDGDYFRIPDVLTELTLDEANAALRDHFRLNQTALSIVWPNGEAAEGDDEEEDSAEAA